MSEVAAPAAAPVASPKAAPAATPAKPAGPALTATSFKRMQSLAPVEAPEAPEAEPEAAPAAEPEASEEEAPESEPEAAPEEELGEEEAPAAADPLDEEIHGISARDILAALKEGKLPDALWDALQDELVDGDDREMRPLRDIKNGAMMARNFTKKSMALAEERKGVAAQKRADDAEREELHQMVRSWKDPVKLKRAARELGLPLQEVAIMWAEDFERRSKLPPEIVAQLDAQEAREVELEKRAREIRAQERKLRELEGNRTQTENTAKGDTYVKFVMGVLPDAFKSVGIQTTPHTEKLILERFKECLGVFWPDDQAPTKEMVFAAAQATAELLGVKRGAAPAAKTSPAAAQVAALTAKKPAAKPLAGAASYDPGKARSPARKALSARTMAQALRETRGGR